jgi:hypothetical protein
MPDLFRGQVERERAQIERVLRYGRVTNMRPYTDHPGQYRAKVEPPPDYLTPDQIDVFDALGVGVKLHGGTFTSEQMRHWAAYSFGHICELEGVGVPSEADVLAEIDLRSPGWPGHWTEPRRTGPKC